MSKTAVPIPNPFDFMTEEDAANQVLIDQLMAEEMINNENNAQDAEHVVVESNEFHDQLWELAHDQIQPLLISRCSIVLHGKIGDKYDEIVIDTGASSNAMSLTTAKKLGLESYIDTNYEGTSYGVGAAAIVGMIPYVEINLIDTVGAAVAIPVNFTVIDTPNQMILLGLPTIMFYKMTLNFESSMINFKLNNKQCDVKMIIKEN